MIYGTERLGLPLEQAENGYHHTRATVFMQFMSSYAFSPPARPKLPRHNCEGANLVGSDTCCFCFVVTSSPSFPPSYKIDIFSFSQEKLRVLPVFTRLSNKLWEL